MTVKRLLAGCALGLVVLPLAGLAVALRGGAATLGAFVLSGDWGF